jgi:alpha-tubulin suppressor-like RCC1 family protein
LGVEESYIFSSPKILKNFNQIKILKLCSGLKHSIVLDKNLTLYSMGFNDVNFINQKSMDNLE